MAARDFGIEEAIVVVGRAVVGLTEDQQARLSEIMDMLLECKEADALWRYYGAPEHEESITVRRARDEVRLSLSLAGEPGYGTREEQFYRRTLQSVLSLVTMRLDLLTRVGRTTGRPEPSDAESLAMRRGFEAAFRGTVSMYEVGAAAQDARLIGLAGGSWAAHILTGEAK